MSVFGELLNQSAEAEGYVLLDGSMGTELFGRGLTPGTAPELWNFEAPEQIVDIHRSYIAAGSDLILTNSFGGTRFRLALHQLDDKVAEVNRVATALATRAVQEVADERRVLVAGCMGPTGELIEPLGSMTAQACREAFAAQANALRLGGVDLLWLETMSTIEEVELAVEGARSVSDLPICATFSFDTAGRTMTGVAADEVAERLATLKLAALGANCGNNLADSEAAVAEILATIPNALVISKCNAGIPQWRDEALRYDVGPDQMAAHAHRLHRQGVRLIGACCGSTPEHIARMAAVLDGRSAPPDVDFKPADRSATSDEGRPEGRQRHRQRTA